MVAFRHFARRALLLYLTEEVHVSPTKRFEVEILGKKRFFVEGEENILPRWLAIILSRYDLVKIKENNEDTFNLAYTIISKQSKSIGLENPLNALVRLKMDLDSEKEETIRGNLIALLKELIELRLPKILNRLPRQGIEEEVLDLDPLEHVLYLELKKIFSGWYDSIFREKLDEII